jgi:cytoskeleton protein RodZ
MPGIGETLREARMRQRLDIADVESRTKIRAKYLRALENEEFGMLPGPTFVKTFLRTYAEVLGLDPYVLLEEYRASYEREDELELQALGPPSAAARDRRGGPRLGPGSVALLVLVAIVAVLVAIGLASGDGADEDGAERAQTTEAPQTQAESAPTPAPPRRVVLRIVPFTPTYVCVDRGAGTPVIFENTIDAPQSWRGRRLRVLLGKRDLQVTTNGKRVEITPGADPIGFIFTPGKSREVPPAGQPCM